MTNPHSEEQFELEVIDRLSRYGWTPRPDLYYKTETELLENWRAILNEQNLDRLNGIVLSDYEFSQLAEQIFAVKTPLQAGKLLANGQLQLVRDVQGFENQKLFLDFFWRHDVGGGRNRYEIVRQIQRHSTKEKRKDNRFDITLLISGIPVIHLELKKANIKVDEAFYQIKAYSENGSFTGFYSMIQIFAILNPDECRYFANFGDYKKFNYKFVFPWANKDNTQTFGTSQFIDHVLSVPMGHKLVSLYTIHDNAKNTLKVLRSYQIYAVEAILDRLHGAEFGINHESKLGGYVWHTTGSGKTMTSFKTAELVSNLPNVDKVIFLADRNELVKQTTDEYSSFAEEDSIAKTANSHQLLKAVNTKNSKLIVTSIQKANKVASLQGDKIKDKNIVFIVDEAHRSTAGEMLIQIREQFSHSIWFGFTGTPLLDENKKSTTTAQLFGNPLHIYSVADGIADNNVLPFSTRQNFTFNKYSMRQAVAKAKDESQGELYQLWLNQKSDLDIENELPEATYNDNHIDMVIKDMMNKWLGNSSNKLFSAMLSVKDINTANMYFDKLKNNPLGLTIAMIYDDSDRLQEGELEKNLQLEQAILHYNAQFGTDFGIDNVPAYKTDLMDRLARRYQYQEIDDTTRLDLVIVVHQLLTGFDAPYLNTLYLDKVMDYANLIQAFSRTNRITDGRKPYGIVEYYRRPMLMKQNIDKAFELYANKHAKGSIMEAPNQEECIANIFDAYKIIRDLFAVNDDGEPDFSQIPKSDEQQKQFIRSMNQLEENMIRIRQHGFEINKPDDIKLLPFDKDDYERLQARYLDLQNDNGGGDNPNPKGALMIDTALFDGERILIDNEYISLLLNKINQSAKNNHQDTTLEQAKFSELSSKYKQTDQVLLVQILQDALQGKLPDDVSLNRLLDNYRYEREQANIYQLVQLFGLDNKLFERLLHHHVLGKEDWHEFNLLKDLAKTADMRLVEQDYLTKTGKQGNKMTLQKYVSDTIKDEIEKILRER